MNISIIMPAYNEERRIGKTLKEYTAYFEALRKKKVLEYEILVVINNTKDKTLEVVKRLKKKNKRIIYLDLKQGGKGYAVIQGFKNALERKNDLIGFVDADMATPPEAFYKLVQGIKGSDATIASRWISGSVIKTKQSIMRRIMSIGFNIIVRSLLFLPYRDTQCGAKLFTREVIEKTAQELGITRWAFDVDLLYRIRSRGFVIKEIPTIWEDKKESHLDIITVPGEMFAAIVRLRLLNSPFKDFVRLYDTL